jgi:hypothetical protein
VSRVISTFLTSTRRTQSLRENNVPSIVATPPAPPNCALSGPGTTRRPSKHADGDATGDTGRRRCPLAKPSRSILGADDTQVRAVTECHVIRPEIAERVCGPVYAEATISTRPRQKGASLSFRTAQRPSHQPALVGTLHRAQCVETWHEALLARIDASAIVHPLALATERIDGTEARRRVLPIRSTSASRGQSSLG